MERLTREQRLFFDLVLEELAHVFPDRFPEGSLQPVTPLADLQLSEAEFTALLDDLEKVFTSELSTFAAAQCRTLLDLIDLILAAPLK